MPVCAGPCHTRPAQDLIVCDAVLVQACRANDQLAWGTLIQRHSPRLLAISRSTGLDRATAEDAVQATWSDLLRHLHELRDPHAVRGWLATTVKRRAIKLSQQRRRTIDSAERHVVADAVIDEDLLRDERVVALRRAVAELRAGDRELLELLFSDRSLSYDEIAGIIGRSIGSIGPTRARCLAKLRTLLERQPEFADERPRRAA